MRRLALTLLAAGFLVACNRTPTAPTGVPLSASRSDHGSAPSLEWSQGTTYDFGTVEPSSSTPVTFTLTNTGGKSSGTVTVSLSTSSVYSITADGCTGSALGPNKSCTVTVEFAPTSDGTFTATLTADAEHGSASLGLTGQAGTWSLSVSPGTLNQVNEGLNVFTWSAVPFELHSGQTASQTFTVTNDGSVTSPTLSVQLDIVDVFISLSNDQCTGNTLAANGTCTFQIDASPTCSTFTLKVDEVDVRSAAYLYAPGGLSLSFGVACAPAT